MDYVEKRNLIKPGSRQNLLRNRLVLIALAKGTATVKIGPNFPLASMLGDGRLSMADPDSVPAGKYGKASLEALGVWKDVTGLHLLGSHSTRQAIMRTRSAASMFA